MDKKETEIVKSALDDFENDDFLSAKEKIQGIIKDKKNTYLKNKLELKNDIEPKAKDDDSKDDKDEGDKGEE